MRERWIDGKRVERWDDVKRVHTTFDGDRVVSVRNFNNAERAEVVREAITRPLGDFITRLRPTRS